MLTRHPMFAGCLLSLCFALPVRSEQAAETPQAPGQEAVEAAHGELADLPAAARQALAAGRVVLLESSSEGNAIGTKLVAVVDSPAEDVISKIRDYKAGIKAFPEVRHLSASKGDDGDRISLTIKPHALLPPMDFEKAVQWKLDEQGTAQLGISLLSTTSKYVADQQSDYRILPLDGERSLVFYEARSSYSKLAFRKKVLRGLCESSEKYLADLRDRCAAPSSNEKPATGAAVALLSTGAVVAPLH